MRKNGRGLLLIMMEIDPEHEEDFNRWYAQEHIAERLGIPGVLSARRFKVTEGSPKYLALYELESPDVIDSEAYKYFYEGGGRTEWTERVMGRLTAFVRNVYVEVSYDGSETLPPPPGNE